MIAEGKKVVMIIDGELPTGLIANTAAVLAITLGNKISTLLGSDIYDGSGERYIGITTTPIPILKSSTEAIRSLRERAINEDLFVVDFSNAAQTTKDYESYTQKLAETSTDQLCYLGIALYGSSKPINKLTGSMPLLR